MTPQQFLGELARLATQRCIYLTPHAVVEMSEASAQYEDVRHALMFASSARLQPNGRWRVVGPDTDGDDLKLIVVIENDVVVITVY